MLWQDSVLLCRLKKGSRSKHRAGVFDVMSTEIADLKEVTSEGCAPFQTVNKRNDYIFPEVKFQPRSASCLCSACLH